MVFLCVSFVLVGIHIFNNYMDSGTILGEYPLYDFKLIGQIKAVGLDRGFYTEYDIDVLELERNKEKIIINERVKLQVTNQSLVSMDLEPSDYLTLGNVSLIEDFDIGNLEGYKLYLMGKGHKAILRVHAKDIIEIDKSKTPNILKTSYKTRNYIENFFDRTLPVNESGILKSIMFGNQGYIDKEILNLFSISGTAHIIAVSGLHVGVLVLIIHYVLKFFCMDKKRILISTMILLLFYSAIANFPVSIIRAVCMYYLYVFAYFIERRYDAINGLMFIAFILLLYNPLNLFSISFQLSFSATLSILLFFTYTKKVLGILPQSLQSLLSVTIAAQLGTIPIMIYHFNQLSLIAIIANVLIVPILAPLLFIAGTGVFLNLISTQLGTMVNIITRWLLAYIHYVVETLASISMASIEIEITNFYYIFIYYLILFGIYFILWLRVNPTILKRE